MGDLKNPVSDIDHAIAALKSLAESASEDIFKMVRAAINSAQDAQAAVAGAMPMGISDLLEHSVVAATSTFHKHSSEVELRCKTFDTIALAWGGGAVPGIITLRNEERFPSYSARLADDLPEGDYRVLLFVLPVKLPKSND